MRQPFDNNQALMIEYSEHTLANGLTVLANRDPLSELAAVNMLYRVGARNEDSRRTGFAHLFEHLMFRGTVCIPDFDAPVQAACGENNAFTNNDYTDYYMTLPKDNIATAFWLESDRMKGLDITPEKLETEKSVVMEEYNQRYLNQPYGEQWLLLRQMVYKVHPYRWPTIGLTPDHIRGAGLSQVEAFYRRYYRPSNAILAVSGDVEPDEVFSLAEEWFAPLPSGTRPHDDIPPEPAQTEARRTEVRRDVPADQITIAFRMGGRLDEDYYVCDVMSDILAGGTSSRLYRELVKRRQMFTAVNAYISGDVDAGMFVLTGQLMPHVEIAAGEDALWGEIERLRSEAVGGEELDKVKNKFEANTLYGELNVMNKALNLCYYSMLGDVPLINLEVEIYGRVTPVDIMETASEMFRRERSSTLVIARKDEN